MQVGFNLVAVVFSQLRIVFSMLQEKVLQIQAAYIRLALIVVLHLGNLILGCYLEILILGLGDTEISYLVGHFVGDLNNGHISQVILAMIYQDLVGTTGFRLKCAILDAVDEGLIQRDPTRKAIIKGKTPREKKPKYLNQYELHKLLDDLDLKSEINLDWLLLLIAKTGMRFSEALALTPKDFDLSRQMLSVSKTWDYKGNGGFLPTKNESSIRKIPLDWQTVMQFAELVRQLPEDEPIFIKGNIYNSTVNDLLARHCKKVEIPVISVHGLRHTHASLLLFAGVSIASVARRLGHSDMTTTQKTYLHIIQELESKDIDIIMRSLSNLNS